MRETKTQKKERTKKERKKERKKEKRRKKVLGGESCEGQNKNVHEME